MFIKFFKISRNIPQILLGIIFNIVEVGKYTIETHEAIGKRIAKNADLFFIFSQAV
ncbi:MAG: hypothetical protein QME57_05355 [Patescibacteria group bacterium]|nr:hypothetical protein [Patescibacteria group bacterium]